MIKLRGAYDHRRGETREDAYVLTLQREPIDNVGREPPEYTHREIESVRYLERNFVIVNQVTPSLPDLATILVG